MHLTSQRPAEADLLHPPAGEASQAELGKQKDTPTTRRSNLALTG
jgi:hypothetical protein